MPQEYYKHIFLAGPTRTQGFTGTRQGGSTALPQRNRIDHSKFLLKQFQQVWETAVGRQAVSHVERRGTYVEFVSEPGFDLALNSLDYRRAGIRLLNVRRQGEQGAEQSLATVYIPNDKRSYFLNKIKNYAEEDNPRSGKPKNANLVDRISDIHLSILESFWQDDLSDIPGDDAQPVEVWLSSDQDNIVTKFNDLLSESKIPKTSGTLKFPERSVEVIIANRNNLHKLIEDSDDIAEFRTVSPVASFFIEMKNEEQIAWVNYILEHTKTNETSDIAICILDSGVNNGHLLIRPILHDSDLHTVDVNWGVEDVEGHGTLMAGTAAYGDLLGILNNTGSINDVHRLESAKIVPPPSESNPRELWGYIMSQGLSRAEIQAPERKRITCMAITSTDDRKRGRPSSWSAMVDSLTSGYLDEKRRLMIISAGNVNDPDDWRNYYTSNLTNEVHDPAQSWNALAVGAYTTKVQIVDLTLGNYVPLAPLGGLSPYSTTSTTWPLRKWPIKPDIVLEGGNVASGPNGTLFQADEMQLLSTYHDPQTAQFAPFNATSAAAALAAWMAATIQTKYPEAWPETVRALLIHSAEWTDQLKKQFIPAAPSKADYARLLRICGYGVPNLDEALYNASNSLTLISQAEIQPYDKRDNRPVTREMHLYRLPWPSSVLSSLGEIMVNMRVTLSYFIEPGPGEIGWNSRYRYASYGLRFEVNSPSESETEFIQRINVQAREDGERPETEGPSDKWIIGQARNVGSIHSDIWQGRAADLAASNLIAIYPTIGWWRERPNLNCWDKRCRYSLIVSIRTTKTDIDIYTPVAIQIGIAVPIEIKST